MAAADDSLCVSSYYHSRYYQSKMAKGIRSENVYNVFLQPPCTFRRVICDQLIICVDYWHQMFIMGSFIWEKSGYLIFGIFI